MNSNADTGGFCCPAKYYYMRDYAMAKTLEILPRVILWKKVLKVGDEYEQLVVIKSTGLYPRKLAYYTDSNDTHLSVYNDMDKEYMEPNKTFHLKVTIRPFEKKNINRNRYIFIEARHPNITFEIPIIISPGTKKSPIVSPTIRFMPTTMHDTCFYDLILYNPKPAPVPFIFKTTCPSLRIMSSGKAIPQKDYTKILLTLGVKNTKQLQNVIKVKFANSTYEDLIIIHNPALNSIYASVSHVRFEELKFGRELRKEFTICNESPNSLSYSVQFLKNRTDSEKKESLKSDFGVKDQVSHLLTAPASQTSVEQSFIMTRYTNPETKPSGMFNLKAYKHFSVNTQDGTIEPNSVSVLTIVFCPVMDDDHFDDKDEPPFLVKTKLFIYSDELEKVESVVIIGYILGPEIEITPTLLDLRVYMGEEFCEHISVLNIDGLVDAHVIFKTYMNQSIASVNVKPVEGFILKPCERGTFRMSFYTLNYGKFMVKLKFKVKSGTSYLVTIKGVSDQVRLKCFPEMIEFGNVSLAIPQKRLVLIMNPLKVPVAVQFSFPDDGEEVPLLLNIANVTEFPPVNLRDPVKSFEEDEPQEPREASDFNFESVIEHNISQLSFKSVLEETSLSSNFDQQILDPLSDLASGFLALLKKKKIYDKTEVESRVLQEALQSLTRTDYFKMLSDNLNYTLMDWNALPSDPKEVYHDSEIFYLKPNTGRHIAIVLVPNIVGHFYRSLQMRICPIVHTTSTKFQPTNDVEISFVSSELLISKLWFEYICHIPHIVWNDVITFPDKQIYVGKTYDFEFEFDNRCPYDGFIFFDVVPDSSAGVMNFKDKVWKFFIGGDTVIYIYCDVIFKQIGHIELPGIVKIVGKNVGMPFHITAEVFPTKVRVTPKSIYHRQKVLQWSKLHIYIENLTPTDTYVKMYLKDAKYQFLDCRGIILAPSGQGMYTTVHSKFYDPGLYNNIVYVDLCYHVKEVKIAINVEDVPIIFDPDINKGIDLGVVQTNTEKNFHAGEGLLSKKIKITNFGQRPYRLNVRKLKAGTTHCTLTAPKSRMKITPKSVLLLPGAEDKIHVTANGYKDMKVTNEFRALITDQADRKRFMNIRFSASVELITPQLIWSRKDICMEYYRSHKFKEQSPLFEFIELTNPSQILVEDINLKVVGPFRIKELSKGEYSRTIQMNLNGLETKYLSVILNKKEVPDKKCSQITKGRVFCTSNNMLQKSLPLLVKVFYPEINIAIEELTLFGKSTEFFYTVQIENVGCLDAEYLWKKVAERTYYISEFDDTVEFAYELLSDIMRMLDLSEEEDIDSLYQRNMTLFYQKFRCKLKKLEDPIGVATILNEIIENLDLENKRFIIRFDDSADDLISIYDSEEHTSESYVEKTLDQVIDRLNLDDTFTPSLPSTEDCFPYKTTYFLDKYGVLPQKEKKDCLLHLPAVRKGYCKTILYELEVCGGVTKFLNITLVNLHQTVILSKSNIYLGARPWYELFKATSILTSVTKYDINVRLEELNKSKPKERISHGYLRVRNANNFLIRGYNFHLVRMDGIMGFSDEFRKEIRVILNETEELTITVRGQGVMPILAVMDKMERIEQNNGEILEEYNLLKRIYYFEIFRSITEEDEDQLGGEEAAESVSVSFSLSTTNESSSTISSNALNMREKRFFRLLQTYVQVTNTEVPDALLLEQILETEKFLYLVKINTYTYTLMNMVYADYTRMLKKYDEKLPINLKNFTSQPLPFSLHGYVLQMGTLKLNKLRKFVVNLKFFGPGTLIASLRTVIRIPGICADLEIIRSEHDQDKQFLSYFCEDKKPDLGFKPYRNIFERELDEEEDPHLKHAHSFDQDSHDRHTRKINAKNRKFMYNYYNSLNKSVYIEHKHHFIMSKLFTNTKKNFTGTNLQLVIFFRPDAHYYRKNQQLLDYIYIDLHMGPTLPILLKGTITK